MRYLLSLNEYRQNVPGLYGIEGEDNEDREDMSLFLPLKGIYTIDLST